MKTLKLIGLIGIVLFSTSAFTGCKQKGCTDRNSDNYDPDAEKSDGSCVYRFSSGIQISTPTGGGYDIADGPELYVIFKKTSSSTWDYTSSVGSNSYSALLTSPEVQFTNEEWKFEMYDYDSLDPDDFIISGTFNPIELGSDGNITLSGSGITITFKYSTK